MSAASRGWGPGWPLCQRDKLATVALASGPRFPVRREIAELVGLLCVETERLGYDLRREDSWGFACRSIRGSKRPSNHSWGLAVDLNARSNPMGSRLVTDIPARVVVLWESYGFTWGGRWKKRPDAMHFEFNGTPVDAARQTARAKATLGQPTEEDEVIADGDDIKDLQEDLNFLRTNGFIEPPFDALKPDGVCGDLTIGALDKVRVVYGRQRHQGTRPTSSDISKVDRFVHEAKHHGVKV